MNENTLAILLLGLSPLPQILQLLSKTLQNRADEWMNNGVEGLQFLPPMSSLCLAVSRERGVCVPTVLRRPQLPRNVVENFAFLLSARRDLCRGERLGERTGGGGGSRGETEVDGVGGEEVLLGLGSKGTKVEME